VTAGNSISGTSGQSHSDFSAYGFAASGWLGATNGWQTRQLQLLDAKTMALYNNVKGDKNRVTSDQHIYIFSPSGSPTVQRGPCCKIALRRQTSASAISVTSKARLSRRCRVFLPISRLDSISYDLRIEFGLE